MIFVRSLKLWNQPNGNSHGTFPMIFGTVHMEKHYDSNLISEHLKIGKESAFTSQPKLSLLQICCLVAHRPVRPQENSKSQGRQSINFALNYLPAGLLFEGVSAGDRLGTKGGVMHGSNALPQPVRLRNFLKVAGGRELKMETILLAGNEELSQRNLAP